MVSDRATSYSQRKKNQIPLTRQNEQRLFYLSNFRYGGCTTFTAHLLHLLNIKSVICLTDAFEKDIGDFGYGICYQRP